MPSRVYWIATFENGARLGIMARPRGEEWLEEEIDALARQRVIIDRGGECTFAKRMEDR